MNKSKIFEVLAYIQAELKAPKSQYNQFGKYKYRKAEDILEAVKPLLAKYGCVIICTDELVLIGDRYYIKTKVTITCVEDGSSASATAYAREEEKKSGMDGSQVTGASSSYARKYALNGLLCIDDTADSDTTNQGPQKPAEEAPAPQPTKTPAKPKKVADKSQDAPKKKVVTDKNIKKIVDWVCEVPEGELRVERMKRAEDSYEWPGDLLNAFYTMVELTQ